MRNLRTYLLAGSVALTSLHATAQDNGSNSPYSRYGFGLLNDRAGGFNKGMSGLAYGMRDGKELNPQNPASYSAIDSLSFLFDVGISLQYSRLKTNGRTVNAKNTSFDYVTMGFRASKNLGMSVGVLPFSTIGYSMSNKGTLGVGTSSEVTQTDAYSGDGGLHEVYLGMGWKPFKPFSIGFNAGYVWGDLTHTILTSFSDATIESIRRRYEADVRTYKLEFGVQYEQRIDSRNSLTIGATYGLGHDVDSKAHYFNQKLTSGSVTSGDTLTAANAFQLPHAFGAGVTWQHDKSLRVGVDYSFQKWGNVKYPTLTGNDNAQTYAPQEGAFDNMHSVTVGAEYVPNFNGPRWRQHVRYRAGFSFSTPYAKINGASGPRTYSASVGVGLPIMNRWNNRSILNISAQYERVQPRMSGMITENYLRLCIGISFNERWFMKWKVE